MSQVSKSQKLPLRKLSRKQLAQGQLLAQGTCARNSRKGSRKQIPLSSSSRKQDVRTARVCNTTYTRTRMCTYIDTRTNV